MRYHQARELMNQDPTWLCSHFLRKQQLNRGRADGVILEERVTEAGQKTGYTLLEEFDHG